jgi:guanosine-3',5'-bis(diphosphate) 3'-pyrophosphohydrolase
MRGFLINMRLTNEKQLTEEIMVNVPDKYEYLVKEAIELASELHSGEYRLSGEPFFIHALNVGRNCARISLDTDSIITGILHQTTSSKFKTKQQITEILNRIRQKFGGDVYELIKTLTYITEYTNLKYGTDLKVLQKYLMSGVSDIRPTLIKICDVLDDAQTCDTLSPEKRPLFAQKIYNVYAPLCEYLNLSNYKKIMEEEVFKYTQNDDFKSVKSMFEKYKITDSLITKYSSYFETIVKDILGYESKIYGRSKGIYSTYVKLKKYVDEGKGSDISNINDIVAFTILGKTEIDCYQILHALQNLCENDPNNFDDYILLPKPNGYKAIHACIQIPEISPLWIEVQIMTDEMNYTNTYGPASHIAYKAAKARFAKATKEHNWVEILHNSILKHKNERENQRSIPISGEFLKNRIFAQTPNGMILELELGSTCIDFAYSIHTSIGNSAVSAVVNGKEVKLSQILNTGDVVEIITRKGKTKPEKEWLEFAQSLSTKRNIREGLRN